VSQGDGLGNYVAVIESSAGRRALIATVLAAALVAALSVAIGGLLAWYAHSARCGWIRAVLWFTILVPFFVGVIPKSYAMVLLLADNGPLNGLLGELGLGPVNLLYTTTGVIAGMVYTMVPYAALCLYGVFLRIDETLIAAARSTGASWTRVATTVVLPLALPGIVAGLALVFAIALGFYVTPVLLGGAEAPFVATLIGEYVLAQFDYPLASAASVMLLAVALLVIGVALSAIGRERLLRAVA
jgi:putative spermidine/putrescine transport system permease protein